jgi:hypothetical protein
VVAVLAGIPVSGLAQVMAQVQIVPAATLRLILAAVVAVLAVALLLA